MSLNFNVTAVPDYITSNPFDEDRLHPVTDYLIWSTLSTGISSITHKNVDEVFRRVAILQKIDGASIRFLDSQSNEMVDVYLTRQDIVNHIGLWTNASSKTEAQFDKMIMRRITDDVLSRYTDGSAHDKVQKHYERWQTKQQAA